MPQKIRFANRFGNVYEYPRERIDREMIDQLKPGDHIAYEEHWFNTYWHHMIVESINKEKEEINVIHYHGNITDALLHPFSIWAKLRSDSYHITRANFYRVVYPENAAECLPPSEVVKKAKIMLEEFEEGLKTGEHKRFSVSTNNCEHFATECKMGTARCYQFATLKQEMVQKGIKELFMRVYEKVIETIRSYLKPVLQYCRNIIEEKAWKVFVEKCSTFGVPQASKVLVENMRCVVDDVVELFFQNLRNCTPSVAAATTMDTALASFGFGIVFGGVFETYWAYHDIREAAKKMEADKISKVEYRKVAAKRVASGVCSVTMSSAGAALGQAFCPIPVLGEILGGLLGTIAWYAVSGLIVTVYRLAERTLVR